MRSSLIKRLSLRHRKLIDMSIEGRTPAEIREHLRMKGANSYQRIFNDPMVQREIARRRDEIESAQREAAVAAVIQSQMHLQEHSLEAAKVQTNLMREDDPNIKYKASNNILEKAGVGVKKDEDSRPNVNIFNAESIALMNLAHQEAFGGPFNKTNDGSKEALAGQ